MQRPGLAEVLSIIAEQNASAFYHGSIAEEIVREVARGGGILTMEDLLSYEPRLETPLSVTFSDTTVHSLPVPSGGPELLFSLNVLDAFLRDKDARDRTGNLTYHHLVEVDNYFILCFVYVCVHVCVCACV